MLNPLTPAPALQLHVYVELIKLVLQPQDDDLYRQRVATLRATLHRDERAAPQAYLADRLGLGGFELNVVWLLAAIEVDLDVRRLVAAIEYTPSGAPTLDGLRRLAYGTMVSAAALRELGEAGRLRSLGIIERCDGGGPGLHEHQQTWALSRAVLAMLLGDDSLDPALASLARIVDDAPPIDTLAIRCDVIGDALDTVMRAGAIVIASGTPGLGRRTMLLATARESGHDVLEIEVARLSKDPALLRVQLRSVARECLVRARVPLLVGLDALSGEALEAVGAELVARVSGIVMATSGIHRPTIDWHRPVIVFELARPSSAQLGALWRDALGESADSLYLANQYPLAPALVRRAAEAARARAGANPVQPEHVAAGVRTVVDDRLGQLARRVHVTQSWLDLVMPQDQVNAVVELMARVRERSRVYEQWGFAAKVGKGLGVTALFSGPPGTGKSMCAALIAKDLGLELYQVDLANIASKWIGETEKNLAALFDAAEAAHAILLFDEADALFGKRTEQRSSNDRHANNETNYLLQRLESYTGICILTSNHETNLDPAFQRRLSLHLRFELPDADERTMLWRAMFPQAAPVDSRVDFDALARRYEMSGGYIRNAALRAAFIAADGDGPITQAHLERAARVEYEGMGKIGPAALGLGES